jgi:hypothetical protein
MFHNIVDWVASLELLRWEEDWYMLPVDWQHEVDTGMLVGKDTSVDGVVEGESLCVDDDSEDYRSVDDDGGEDGDLELQSCMD